MGEIKKYQVITSNDIDLLKTTILSIYQKRQFLSETGLTNINSNGFGNTSIATNNYINQNFYYGLNALLQLNNIQNITVVNSTNDIIFQTSASVNEDLFTVVNTWNGLPLASEAKPISCRAGCVGLCWDNCSAACVKQCTASNAGPGSYGNPAPSGPHGRCGTGSESSCSSYCTGQCKTYCYEACKDGCKGCKYSCNTECYGSDK